MAHDARHFIADACICMCADCTDRAPDGDYFCICPDCDSAGPHPARMEST